MQKLHSLVHLELLHVEKLFANVLQENSDVQKLHSLVHLELLHVEKLLSNVRQENLHVRMLLRDVCRLEKYPARAKDFSPLRRFLPPAWLFLFGSERQEAGGVFLIEIKEEGDAGSLGGKAAFAIGSVHSLVQNAVRLEQHGRHGQRALKIGEERPGTDLVLA